MAKLSRNLVVNATINKRSLNATAEIANSASGLREVFHDDSMLGKGTANDPLRINLSIIPNVEELNSKIQAIQDLIPLTASLENPLADQGFVNSSIQTATAYFRGDWATWADVPSDPELYPVDATGNHTPTTNDYMVVIADEQTNGGTWRYKYTGLWSEQGKSGWQAEYQVNETPFTAAQNAAINSGVTAQAVSDIAANKTAVANLQTSKQNKLTAGTGITIEGDTISATGGSGGSGDYLPLSGGEITGAINYNVGELQSYLWSNAPLFTATYSVVGGSYTFYEAGLYATVNGMCIGYKGAAAPMLSFLFRSNKIEPQNNQVELGTYSNIFKSVATKKLVSGVNASAYSVNEIIVPQKTGTMALVEDIDAVVGDISTALTAILGE